MQKKIRASSIFQYGPRLYNSSYSLIISQITLRKIRKTLSSVDIVRTSVVLFFLVGTKTTMLYTEQDYK